MRINPIYRLEKFPLKLRVVRAFDFEIQPILLLEQDVIGNHFLSYLIYSDNEKEQRAYLQISNERLQDLLAFEITLQEVYSSPENNHIFIAEFTHETGSIIQSYLVPGSELLDLAIIPEDYELNHVEPIKDVVINQNELLGFSERRQKIVFDFYLQSQNLINSIKPYAIYKVFTPIVEIIKGMMEFDARNADKFLAFSNLRQASFGITIEINYSNDLFLHKETEVLETIIELLNAQKKEDFQNVISRTKDDKYLKHYKSIIKAVIDNNANLHSAYANPVTGDILISMLDKDRAEIAKVIIDETFDVIEDIEEIKGTFLEIDVDRREPSFKIHSLEEDFTLKGKFELSIIEKVKNDFINIGKETYKFKIKTIYYPETTLNPEEIKRFLIDYQKE